MRRADAPTFLMTDPTHFDVAYAINPWMAPEAWARDRAGRRQAAHAAWTALRTALEQAGATVLVTPGAPGLPDMAFPANCAVVLDGRALLGRFRHPERRGEEPRFRAALEALVAQGVLREVAQLPEGCFQEGAGDCVWDAARGRFWAGVGPRSTAAAADAIARHFDVEVTPLELVSDRYYHMDVALCALPGGELLWYPDAFSADSRRRVRAAVPADLLLDATPEDAAGLCLNGVAVGRTLVGATAPAGLRTRLAERGYDMVEVDLTPFIESGGAAFCMTLRLDLTRTAPVAASQAALPSAIAAAPASAPLLAAR